MAMRGAALLLCVGGLAVVGCSGGGGPDALGDGGRVGEGGPAAMCGKVQPCGGDVVGSWMFVEECESAAGVAAMQTNFATMAAQSWCVGQTLVGIEPQANGSLVFDAAGTY